MSFPRLRSRPLNAALLGGLTLATLLLSAGCADMATDLGLWSKARPAPPPKEDRIPPVTRTGRAAAVVSVHTRKAYENACKFGITLTNNLPFKITALSFRFTALIGGGVPFDSQTKSFSELRPSEDQYREMIFQGVRCDQIQRLEVTDPGRCALDTLNRFNSAPGDCAKYSDIASSSLITVAKKDK